MVRPHFWEWGPLQRNHPVAVMPSPMGLSGPFSSRISSNMSCRVGRALSVRALLLYGVTSSLSTACLISSAGSRPVHRFALFNVVVKVVVPFMWDPVRLQMQKMGSDSIGSKRLFTASNNVVLVV